MRCDKEEIALCAFFKNWGRIVVRKDIFVWDSAQKFCKNYRAARYFSFCAFCLKAAEGIGASQNIFVHSAFLAYVFYDFLRLPLKSAERIYSARRRPVKKYVCQAQSRRMFKRYWHCAIRAKYIYYLSRWTLKSTYWIFVNKHLPQWINLKI